LEYKSEYIRDNVLGRELDSPNTVYPFQLAEMLERLEACCDVLDRVRRTG
jgi:hypothetical protein